MDEAAFVVYMCVYRLTTQQPLPLQRAKAATIIIPQKAKRRSVHRLSFIIFQHLLQSLSGKENTALHRT